MKQSMNQYSKAALINLQPKLNEKNKIFLHKTRFIIYIFFIILLIFISIRVSLFFYILNITKHEKDEYYYIYKNNNKYNSKSYKINIG